MNAKHYLLTRKSLLLGFMLLCAVIAKAGRVDTVMVKSLSMNKDVQVVVVTPEKKRKLSGHLSITWVWWQCKVMDRA